MTLKAIIPSGQTELTVNGLHQWDYGQKLEIHSSELPAIVEVHFACAGMKEAVVRVCETVDGVAVAAIPDRCLEQTTPITAWVYEIDDTAGFTTKTITLPIIPRTKPQPGKSVPEEFIDKYAEAISALNEAGENFIALADEAVNTVNSKATQAVNTVNKAASEAEESFKTGDVVVKEAIIASYASADKTKGTIEERLTKLGFREGTVTIEDLLGGTITTNTLKRQGNYVIGAVECSDGYCSLSMAEHPGCVMKVGTIPEGFRPKADVDMVVFVDNTTILGYPYNEWYCRVNTAGEIFLYTTIEIYNTEVKGFKIYIGYEAT